MATQTKAPNGIDWRLRGGIAAAVIAAGVALSVFEPFGISTPPGEPVPTAPMANEALLAATE